MVVKAEAHMEKSNPKDPEEQVEEIKKKIQAPAEKITKAPPAAQITKAPIQFKPSEER